MNFAFEFYAAMERTIPQGMFGATTAERIIAVERAMQATGSLVGEVRGTIEAFAEAFEAIGAAMELGSDLAQMAIALSPHDLLDDDDPNWRMGFFNADIVEPLNISASEHQDALGSLDAAPAPTPRLRDLFLAACDEAAASGQAVVILHRPIG